MHALSARLVATILQFAFVSHILQFTEQSFACRDVGFSPPSNLPIALATQVLDDLPDVNRDDDSRVQSEQVQAAFQATSSPEHPSGLVIKGLWEAKKKPFIKAGVYKLVQDGLQLVSPIILEFLLKVGRRFATRPSRSGPAPSRPPKRDCGSARRTWKTTASSGTTA